MGIGIVLLFWGVVGSIAATVGSVVLSRVASHFVPEATPERRKLTCVVAWFPFACLAWGGLFYIGYGVVNFTVFSP
jgi:hypothetical protein